MRDTIFVVISAKKKNYSNIIMCFDWVVRPPFQDVAFTFKC